MNKQQFFGYILLFSLANFFYACDLERDIIIELPPYQSKLVVEAYLEHGKPFRLLLSESVNYFEAPALPIIANAQVRIIKPNGTIERLQFKPDLNLKTAKGYNFISENLVDSTLKGTYILEIVYKDQLARATTTFLPPPKIEEIKATFNDKSLAFLQVRFLDNNPNEKNYYRLLINRDSLGGNEENDFVFESRFTTDSQINLITTYKFEVNDTIVVSVFHIEKAYYDFLETAEEAFQANGNPFAQPAVVSTNISGGVGIFTALAFERRTFILRKDGLEYINP